MSNGFCRAKRSPSALASRSDTFQPLSMPTGVGRARAAMADTDSGACASAKASVRTASKSCASMASSAAPTEATAVTA